MSSSARRKLLPPIITGMEERIYIYDEWLNDAGAVSVWVPANGHRDGVVRRVLTAANLLLGPTNRLCQALSTVRLFVAEAVQPLSVDRSV